MQSTPEHDPTLRDLLKIFDRRRRTILWTAGVVFLLSVCLCLFMTRRYSATSEIEYQKSSSSGLDMESMMGDASGGASDSLSVNIDLQTQSSVLQSEELELSVIKDLNLETEDFKPKFGIEPSSANFWPNNWPNAVSTMCGAPRARALRY